MIRPRWKPVADAEATLLARLNVERADGADGRGGR